LSPTSKAWQDKHGKLKEDLPLEIKDYDADDVKRMTRHRQDDEVGVSSFLCSELLISTLYASQTQ